MVGGLEDLFAKDKDKKSSKQEDEINIEDRLEPKGPPPAETEIEKKRRERVKKQEKAIEWVKDPIDIPTKDNSDFW